MNSKKVPQLFVATGATKWNDPQNFPWTMGWQPNYQIESIIYAKYILKNHPNAKIAVLYQNDDYGKDYLKGFKDGLGAKAASMIVIEDSYEVSEPTIDSHIVKMKATGADIFFNVTTPKFAAQAIKKNAEIGWKPLHFLNNVSGSIGSVIKPAGFENAQDIISSQYFKDPTDAQWKDDKAMIGWNEFLDKYYPEANRADASVMYGYIVSQGLVHVLKACGDNLTRENIMKQAASIRDFEPAGLLPGIKVNTSASDFAPLSQLQLIRFKGEHWERFGEVLSGDVGG
ncbi:ABC-type branched-subunit amino acid transport system substrate-binding protein [Bradyrhizobium liaoningense]